MTLLTPQVPTISNPVLLDKEIQRMQLKLATDISWLQYSFGRAYRQKKMNDTTEVEFPEVYQGKDFDYLNVMPHDYWDAISFWYPTSAERIMKNTKHEYSRSVALIMFIDLKKISVLKSYVFTEELKVEVMASLEGVGGLMYNSEVNGYTDVPNDVYAEFSTDYIKPEYYNKRFAFMRFDITLNYPRVC